MGTWLGIAVVLCLLWLVRLVVGRAAHNDRALAARDDAEQDVRQRIAESVERPGFLPEQPLVVVSAAAAEPRAESEPCPICEGPLHVATHEVDERGAVRLRRLQMRCGDCGRTSTIWVELSRIVPN